MNEKIAILTLYYHNYNYGGLLQAYALQKVLSAAGYQVEQISYQLASGYNGWNPIKARVKKPVAHLYHYLKYGKWFNKYVVRQKKFDTFAEKVPHTRVVTVNTIKKLSDEFDCFICGSDQIWNPIGWQPTLFFDFLPDDKKRISYAASIARDSLSEQEYDFIKSHLDKFIAISVREQNSAVMLNKRFPTLMVKAVPDPVFLLDEENWRKLIPTANEGKKPYIFAYFLGENKENRENAIRYAREKKIEIKFASYLDYTLAAWDRTHVEFLTAPLGIEDFLQSIAEAELVLTDSFHAAAFSSILKTPFFVVPRFKAKDSNSMNSRILNLVQEMEIPERYTENPKMTYQWSDNERTCLEKNLKLLRERGLQFLENSIN